MALDLLDGNGGTRRLMVGAYRAAVIGLIAICGYFLRDLHDDVRSTGINVGMIQTQVAVLKNQLDMQFAEFDRRLGRLERAEENGSRNH